MVRFLIFLVGMLTTNRPGGARAAPLWQGDSHGRAEPDQLLAEGPDDGDAWFHPAPPPPSPPQWPYREAGRAPVRRDRASIRTSPRRRIPRKLTWAAVLVLAGLVFRKVIAWAVLVALSAALHVLGINVRLPHIKLAWPWQTISAGTTTDTDVGPWVLQKIEGISRPALGTENFNFTFTHKVSKNIGIWPCWYSSTFATVGHASATVNLNPGRPGGHPRPATTGYRSSAARRRACPAGSASLSSCPSRSYRNPFTTSPSTTRCRIRLTCSTAGPIPGSVAAR